MSLPVQRRAIAMLTRRARAKGASGTAGEAVLGSWVRTCGSSDCRPSRSLAVVVGLAITGRLGDLRYTNIPLVHEWLPAGMVFNPLNPGDRSDVISAATQAKVKTDLIADGQIELDAVRTGDASRLPQADSGRNLSRTQAIVAANVTSGITDDFANNISRYVVGHRVHGDDPSWQHSRGEHRIGFEPDQAEPGQHEHEPVTAPPGNAAIWLRFSHRP
jgi:hypothetical protein